MKLQFGFYNCDDPPNRKKDAQEKYTETAENSGFAIPLFTRIPAAQEVGNWQDSLLLEKPVALLFPLKLLFLQ